MQNNSNLSFAAIITIEVPGSEEQTQLRVRLLPADNVPLGSGQTKPLQDCTLAELQQFAEKIESELWNEHGSKTLIDLLIGGEAEIHFRFAEEQLAESSSDKLWLEHAIIFPDGKPAAPSSEIGSLVIDETSDEELTPDSTGEELQGQDEAESVILSGEAGTAEPSLESTADLPSSEPHMEPQQSETSLDEDSVTMSKDEAASALQVAEGTGDIAEEITPKESEELAPDDLTDTALVEEIIEGEEVTGEDKLTAAEVGVPSVRVLGLRRPLHHPTWTAVDILANESAFRNAQAHALTSLNKEVAGVLIGPQPEKKPDGRYIVHVADTIIAKHTRMHGASVTYTPESWRYINDKLEERYPDESTVILGWYHTHPGFGIFLSGMDLFIHQNFFTQKWHIALVLDPRARRSGFFCWDRAMTKVDAYEFPWPKWAADSW